MPFNDFHTVTIEADGLTDPFVYRVTCHEALSWPFELVVDFALWGSEAPLTDDEIQALLDGTVKVNLGKADEDVYHGIFRSIDTIAGATENQFLYRGVVVPRLWLLSQTKRSRVFLEMSVEAVVKAVLVENGLAAGDDFTIQSGMSTVWEFILQYEETDLAFISRLLEQAGSYYRFDHGTVDHVEIVTASSSAPDLAPTSAIPFDPHGRTALEGQADGKVVAFTHRRRSVPKELELRDYNYRTALLDLKVDTAVDAAAGRGRQHLFGDHYKDVAGGKATAKLRSEEIMATRTTLHGQSTIRSLRAGVKFTMTESPFEPAMLVTEVRHTVKQVPMGDDSSSSGSDTYLNEFVALPASVPYRPPRITPRPRIHGLMHAKVDGESPGTKAPLDSEGRYKVAFPFDCYAQAGGKASRWVRMAQPFAGQGYGFHIPLHIGTEVLVGFVDGDPDRPVIMAAAPNLSTTPPVVDANATQSVLRTRAAIHIELEDDAT